MLHVFHRTIALSLLAGLYGACTDRETDPDALCEVLVEKARDCSERESDDDFAVEVQGCEDARSVMRDIYGPDCGALYDELLECTTKLACDGDIEAACADEIAAIDGCRPEPGPVCKAFGEGLAACGNEVAPEDLEACQVVINERKVSDAECGEALEAHYTCLGERSCDEQASNTGCEATESAMDAVCEPYEDGPPAPPNPLSSSTFTR